MHFTDDELARTNSGKRGKPYAYCASMMLWLAAAIGFGKETTFRKAAGIAAGILESHGLESPHYSTILRRVSDPALAAVPGNGGAGSSSMR